jgi:hypothetical protein
MKVRGETMLSNAQHLSILQTPSYPSRMPFMPKGIQRILDDDVASFEEAVRCVIDAYQEAEHHARQANDHRWADEIAHFGALFHMDADAFLDCYLRAAWQTNDEAERQHLAVEEFRRHAGEFGEMIIDALDDLAVLACNPDELVDLWLITRQQLAVHPRPSCPSQPHSSSAAEKGSSYVQ